MAANGYSNLPKALYSTAPEALHSTAPEAVPQKQAGLEAYQLPHYDNNKRNDNYKSSPEKRILGLQPVTFWLLLVLTLVIVAAAIGGGVGGGILANKSRTPTTASTNSATTSSTGTKTATSLSPTSGQTSSTSSTPSPSAYPPVVLGDTRCPNSNGTKYTSQYGTQFQTLCNIDISVGANDLANPATGNLQLCMDQCAMWNVAYAPNSVCHIAVFNFGGALKTIGGKNCWLKNVTITQSKFVADDQASSGLVLNY